MPVDVLNRGPASADIYDWLGMIHRMMERVDQMLPIQS